MSDGSELSRLFAAERAEARPAAAAAQGLVDLRDALHAGVAPLAVAHGPLAGLGATVAVKSAVLSGVVALGLTASGLAWYAETPASEPAPHMTASASASGVAKPVPLPTPLAAPAPAPAPSIAPPHRAAPPAANAASEPEPPSTFAEELRLIKAAKQDVDAERDSLARVRLDEHARLYPQGVFRSEREALAVLLTCRATPTEGHAAAQRYVDRNPGSPLVDRIARACRLPAVAVAPARSAETATPVPVPTVNFPDAGNEK